ncbi:protein PLANT CADMIUM RESISTANCE 12 isoform X1 [Alnus glutinosa]|uniref:protein PLANT CADMIUM RESISTANCE 12 isoform X1 n=1 Tax=Alnus glutinosa TaxID=3517 RepID=UPI002D781F00|nr:protein PLANT CADMIUM RESISTANCE 12 isoform X1 [Alnus glutinosa]
MGDLEKRDRAEEEEEENERFLEGMAVVDFDMLCSTVALQAQRGKWRSFENVGEEEEEEGGEFGGVLRMWEGEVQDCFDDRRIAIESACCPCYRFGKNMRRAGFGSCFIQGTVYFILAVSALLNWVAFIVTKRHFFLYLAVAFTISLGTYLGFFRTQIKKKFNIRGRDSSLDDCIYHLICPCCTLCQESRTLEMNNVQDGTWHGRGDTICIGGFGEGSKAFFELQQPPLVSINSPEPCSMPKSTDGSDRVST